MKPTLAQLRRLVGNPNAYALQRPDGSWLPMRMPLTDAVLLAHLNRTKTVGTYVGHKSGGDDDRSTYTHARTLVFDMDTENAFDEAERVGLALIDLGIAGPFIGTEFSGKKGYHVWVVLQEYQPNADLRRVGRAVLALAGVKCEVFPKQDTVSDLGNLIKLPGSIHQVTGKANDFVGPVPRPLPTPVWKKALLSLPPEQKAKGGGGESRFPCLEHIQKGIDEGGRNIQLFHLATMFRRHGADDELLDTILNFVNQRSHPPLDEREVESILDGSRTSGPLCDQLPGDLRDACGDYCMKARIQGLHTKPDQLRHARVGENVVVRLEDRAEDEVRFWHQDLQDGKGTLRKERHGR